MPRHLPGHWLDEGRWKAGVSFGPLAVLGLAAGVAASAAFYWLLALAVLALFGSN